MVKDNAPKAGLPANFLWGFATAAYVLLTILARPRIFRFAYHLKFLGTKLKAALLPTAVVLQYGTHFAKSLAKLLMAALEMSLVILTIEQIKILNCSRNLVPEHIDSQSLGLE